MLPQIETSQKMATRISCLCGLANQEVALNFQSEYIPVPSLCHCRSCRSTSGVICTSYIDVRQPTNSSIPLHLIRYLEAPDISRWFCGTCGAHVFLRLTSPGRERLLVAAGLVVHDQAPRTDRIHHRCVSSTDDGGIASFLQASSDGELLSECYTAIQDKSSLDERQYLNGQSDGHTASPDPVWGSKGEAEAETDPQLCASCHCGGVQFYITPPDDSSKSASFPWPDLLVPYHSGSHDNSADVKWWLRGEEEEEGSGSVNDDRSRRFYLAGLCACNSCRLASGFPIQSWAFVPRTNIFKLDGSPLSYDITTLQRYESSPGVYREFCRACGATVFWHCEERPGVVDVSVGLLQAKTGARAEGWLRWAINRVSFSEQAPDKGLIRTLQDGLRTWAECRGNMSDAIYL